jgi:tryptophan halogenase
MNNKRKIIIVGGGTAGWMAAAYLAKYHGSENVTVVESATIPKIGVGESVTPHVYDFFEEIGMDEADWMKETGAIHKYANKFINWCGTNDTSYFSFNYTTPTTNFYKDIAHNTSKEQFLAATATEPRSIEVLSELAYDRIDEYICPQFHYMENNVSPYKNNELLLNQPFSHTHHINAELAGTYIKNKIATNVTNIIANVTKVTVKENNIESIELDNGTIMQADLFIDCTGFRRVLVNALGWKTKAYDHPIDSAWVCPTDYDDPETEMVNYTNTVAEPYGWRFNLALYHRMGNGYCYSSKHISDKDAKAYFLKQIKPPKKEPRLIKWVPERLETFAAGNCAAVGLSCGFVEPLEANALYTIVTSVRQLNKILSAPNLDFTTYNEKMAHTIDDIANFILVHYTLSPRTDTKFWTDMQIMGKEKNHAALVEDKIYNEKNTMNGALTGYTMFPDYMWAQLAAHWNIDFNIRNKASDADKTLAKMHFDFNNSKHKYISSLCENNYTWLKNNIFENISSSEWQNKYGKS